MSVSQTHSSLFHMCLFKPGLMCYYVKVQRRNGGVEVDLLIPPYELAREVVTEGKQVLKKI